MAHDMGEGRKVEKEGEEGENIILPKAKSLLHLPLDYFSNR
jgi:hypothetical protein